MNIIHYLYLCASLGYNPNKRLLPVGFGVTNKEFLVPTTSTYGNILDYLVSVGIVVAVKKPIVGHDSDKIEVVFTEKGIDFFKKAHNRFTNGMEEVSNDEIKELSTVKVKGQVLIGHAMAYLLGTGTQFALTAIKGLGRKMAAVITLEAPPDSDFTATFIDSFGEK